MARKRDDKRVLRVGNGRQQNSRRNRRIRNNNRRAAPMQPVKRRTRKKQKTSKTMMVMIIIALVAFVIGAGIGVSLSFEDDTVDEGPHYENVTKEMTNGLNETEQVYFEKDVDDVDFNENDTSQLNLKTTNSGD